MVNVEDPLADRLRDDVTDGAVALGPVASHDQEDGQPGRKQLDQVSLSAV